MVERELWLEIVDIPRDKLAAHRLESGRRGVTALIRRRGLHVLVVGRDGCAYTESEWPESETFWQAGQGNLLVEDNQTRAYDRADARVRSVLAAYAWGPQARSEPTSAASA